MFPVLRSATLRTLGEESGHHILVPAFPRAGLPEPVSYSIKWREMRSALLLLVLSPRACMKEL